MPHNSTKKADVLCPFYRFDDCKTKRIVCEGVVDRSTLAQTYLYKRGYEKQMRIFCCKNYKNCEIYRMLLEAKYEED